MWNYRIIKKDEVYELREAYYNDNQEIFAICEFAEITGESPEDIIESLKYMLDDAVKYKDMVLEDGKIEFASMCDDEDLEEESISGINMPPLDRTDPDVEVNDWDNQKQKLLYLNKRSFLPSPIIPHKNPLD